MDWPAYCSGELFEKASLQPGATNWWPSWMHGCVSRVEWPIKESTGYNDDRCVTCRNGLEDLKSRMQTPPHDLHSFDDQQHNNQHAGWQQWRVITAKKDQVKEEEELPIRSNMGQKFFVPIATAVAD